MCVCHYQAVLGLQLDLQGLQGPPELADLTFGRLKSLCAACHLLVQLVKLQDIKSDLFRMQQSPPSLVLWPRVLPAALP